MRYFGGVDPDKEGAVAVVNESGDLVALMDMDEFRGREWQFVGQITMMVEAQHAFPKINATTNFKMGQASGFWRGWCWANGSGLLEVSASKWQREVCGTLPKDRKARKRAICEWAERRWPGSNFRGARGGVKDGRSDAACIALYCRRTEMAYFKELAAAAAEEGD